MTERKLNWPGRDITIVSDGPMQPEAWNKVTLVERVATGPGTPFFEVPARAWIEGVYTYVDAAYWPETA